jgi:tape measure domain-containing protein
MSNVDERIVEMRFDNKQFESNVQTTIKSLDDLKAGLNLDASAQSLSNLDRAGRSFSLAGIAEGVDNIANKFSTLGIIGMTALQNLTNAAISAGARMVSSFTIDPIKMGFQEYETKMGAIQTILTNTQGGQKKVIQQNASAVKQASTDALSSAKQSNADAVDDLQKSQAKQLKEYQKTADAEMQVIEDKYNQETEALDAANKAETAALDQTHKDKIAIMADESQTLDDNNKDQLAALETTHSQKIDLMNKETDALKQAISDENDAVKKAHEDKLAIYDEEYMAKLKVVNEDKYNEIKAIDDKISSIKDLTKAEDVQIKQTEEQNKLAELQKNVNTAKSSKDRTAAIKALNDYETKLERERLLAQRATEIQNLENDKTAVKTKYDAIIANIQTEYATRVTAENERYKTETANLQTQQAEKLRLLTEVHNKEKEELNNETELLKKQQADSVKALDKQHEIQKENLRAESDLLKEQQNQKEKDIRKNYALEKQLMTENHNAEKDALKERQDDEMSALRKRNEASVGSMKSSGGAGGPVQYEITKGSSLDDVNSALAELNDYSDKTIYNFAEMAKNVGTFTAAGVGLKESVTAIKGIANLAAGSGSTSAQASSAMYQLSQALAAGSLKLQDWNSVVNAGMGGQLFQNGLKDTAKEMGIVVDESIPFRESLEKGWVTADVLTKTLAKFAADESLLKAATQVKTYTQLVDTLKESMQSGWATTWENIIGNKDEATALFTAINDGLGGMITSSANARNAMLSFWGDNGGRTMVIDGLTNSFKALEAILAPIGDAFREIFPPMTGQRLLDISKSFLDLTEKFKIGEETAKNIKSTFAGLFAILDIGARAFTFIAQCVGLLVSALAPGAGGLLSVSGGIGDFIVTLRNFIVESDAFGKALTYVATAMDFVKAVISTAVSVISGAVGTAKDTFAPYVSEIQNAINSTDLFAKALDGIKNVFAFVADGLKEVINKIKGVSSEFEGVNLDGTSAFSEKLSWAFNKLSDAGDRIKETFKNVIPILEEVGSTIRNMFGPAMDYLAERIKSINLADVGTMLAGGGFLLIAKGIKDFLGSIGGITKGFNEVIDGISGTLEAFQTKVKAEALLKIAMAIGLLAASVLVLSSIDQESLSKALAALTALFVELGASMMFLDKTSSVTPGITGKLIALGVAVLLIATAMKTISDLDQNGIQSGIQGLAAILMLLAAFVKITDGTSGIQGSISGIIGLSLGILLLAKAVEKFGSLDQKVLEQGIQGVAASLISLGLFIKLAGDPEHMIAVGLGITAISVAMNIFAGAVALFGLMPLDMLTQGVIAMAAILGTITLMMNLMPNDAQMIATGVALNLMGIALYSIAGAVAIFGNMSIQTLAIGIGALAAALLVMAASANLMTGTLSGAAALLVMAIAINTLVPAIALLGAMDIKSIGIALLAIAGIFVILGLSALVLAPLAPVILSLAASVAVLGLGVMAIGGGLVLLAAGLAAIAVGGGAFIAAIIAIGMAIFDLIPAMVTKIGEGVVAFATAISKGMPAIVDALASIATSLITVFIDVIPPLIDAAMKFMLALLAKLNEYIEPLTDAGMKLIIGFLKGISANMKQFTEVAIELMLEFLRGINSKQKDILQVATDLIINFIDGVSKMTNKLVEAGFTIMIEFINGLAKTIRDNVPLLVEAFNNLGMAVIEGLAKGLIGGIVTIVKAIGNIGQALIDGFKDVLGIHSPSRVFNDLGGYVIEGLINGINACVSWIRDTVNFIGGEMVGKFNQWLSSFVDIGKNMMDGIITGVTGMATKVGDAIKGVGSAGVDGLKNLLGIHSPSRVFGEIGKFSMIGFANGISDYAGRVSDEANSAGTNAMDSLKGAMANISDIVSGNIDANPTIRPVLDLTDITAGSSTIDSLLSKDAGITLSSSTSKASSISDGMKSNVDSQNGSGTIGMLKEILTANPQPVNVTVISQLDGREIARVTAPAMSEELAYLNNRSNFALGRG